MGASIRPRTSPTGTRENLGDLIAARVSAMNEERPQTSPEPDRKVLRTKSKKKYRWQEIDDLALPAVRTSRKEPDILNMSFGRSTKFGATNFSSTGDHSDSKSQFVGEKNMPKYRVERKLKESKQDKGEKLFERLEMYKKAHRQQVKKMLQDSGHNYQTENKLACSQYVDWYEDQRKAFRRTESAKALLNHTRRKIFHEEKIKETLKNSSEARKYRRLRDRAVHAHFVERLKTHQSSIKSRWLVNVLLAARSSILVEAHEKRQQQLFGYRVHGAAMAIRKFMMWQWKKRCKQKSATLIMQFLQECSMEQKMIIFSKRVRRSVIKVQRYWRARMEITEAHIELLCRQWDSLRTKLDEGEEAFLFEAEPGEKLDEVSELNSPVLSRGRSTQQVSFSDDGGSMNRSRSASSNSQAEKTLSRTASGKKLLKRSSSRKLSAKQSSNQNTPRKNSPRKKSKGSKKNKALAATVVALASKPKLKVQNVPPKPKPIPRKIQVPLVTRWLLDHRQRFCNDAFMYDEYDLWPIFVEVVRARSLAKKLALEIDGKKLQIHDYCKEMRLRGRMRKIVLEHADASFTIPKPPVFRRFLTESDATNLHRQARSLMMERESLGHQNSMDSNG